VTVTDVRVPDVNGDTYTVGAVARLAGVSVRTLHHYDQIGLLSPGARSSAGYRLYSLADLKRLQQILYYRELGFPLEEIAAIMTGPGEDAPGHLRRQHRLLREQISRRQALLAAIEKEMEAVKMGISLSPEEQLQIFGTDKVGGEWADEARQRWGDTEAWKQSQRRTAAYTKQDWIEIQAEATSISQDFLAALRAGIQAGDPQAMDAAERHRQHIGQRFYDCDHTMHRCLAEMYIGDERFRQNYDEMAPGLAQYVHDAIQANASRA
jgi:MerR family transcriptional regulator, thiopeptide resistance regulator